VFPTSFDDAPLPSAEPTAALPQRRYRTHCEEVWEAARADYAEGWSATDVCLRYDLGLSALRTRARTEGWRRADLADAEPLPSPACEPAEALAMLELVDLAWRRASEAIARGKPYEARVWMRLTGELREQIKAEVSEAEHRRGLPARNAERAQNGRPPLAPTLHPLHCITRVQSAADKASPLLVDQLQDEHRSGQQQTDSVGSDQGPAFQADPIGDPQAEPDHGGDIHSQGDRRGVPLSPNLKHLGRETAHREQGGGDAEGDDIQVHRPSTARIDRGCGGKAPCAPG
jgi:hypothetical protein